MQAPSGRSSGGGAPPAGGQQDACWNQLLLILPMILIFYFLLIRPQQKRDKELRAMIAAVQKGDRVVTLGSHEGAPFVPGVPIGTVDDVQVAPGALSRIARITPAVDFAALDMVGVVVKGPAEDPRDSVLPPKPDPKGDQ